MISGFPDFRNIYLAAASKRHFLVKDGAGGTSHGRIHRRRKEGEERTQGHHDQDKDKAKHLARSDMLVCLMFWLGNT